MTVARNGVQKYTAQSPGTWLILHKCPVPEHPSESSVAELKGHPLGLCISSVVAWLLSILVTLNTHIGRMAQIIHSHKYDSNRCMSKHLDKGVGLARGGQCGPGGICVACMHAWCIAVTVEISLYLDTYRYSYYMGS